MEQRIKFDENGTNGFVIGNVFLPEELLAGILFHVDHHSLLNCQLVCKRWNMLLKNYIWRRKAESIVKRPLPSEEYPWQVSYIICEKRPFERNLIRNHSGKKGPKKNWQVLSNNGEGWKVECPPVGVPHLPSDMPVFEGQQSCFVTSFGQCSKEQIIDLKAVGLTELFLDNYQPTITVSEWYSSRWDCSAIYECRVMLCGEEKSVLDTFQFHDSMEGERQNQWFHVSHVFKNYGKGLRRIRFNHSGRDKQFWAGHYGSKMAGACVWIDIPKLQP